MICTDFSPFFICVNHKNLHHLRAIFTQNYAERSIIPGVRHNEKGSAWGKFPDSVVNCRGQKASFTHLCLFLVL
jgi:hypothetical protein